MSRAKIGFFCENIQFKLKNIRKTRSWLSGTVLAEGRDPGEISIIFCDDAFLHAMNVKYLSHDTLTDVITFDYSEGSIISGDVFISIERVKENSVLFSKTLAEELNRVMVHGILHLCGYKDKTPKDSKFMRQKEEQHLALFPDR